jgi:hypothetical protein
VGLILTLWLGIGAQVYKPPVKGNVPPTMTDTHCPLNTTFYDMTTAYYTAAVDSTCSLDNSSYVYEEETLVAVFAVP